MNKILTIFVILILISSCNQTKQDVVESTEKSREKIEEKKYWNLPNSETKTEIIETNEKQDNIQLFSKFKIDLNQDYFKIENTELNKEISYNNCNKNIIIRIKGKGIRKYYIKRQKDKPKNYYPDFILCVYEFENDEQAEKVENIIAEALSSGNRFCNGKAPEIITRNGNEVYQLSTRAEMFRGYINKYGEKLKNYR